MIDFTIYNVVITFLIYSLPLIIINLTLPLIINKKKNENIKQELISLKMNSTVFETFLHKQPYYKITKNTSSIIFGNKSSNTVITIFSNPHCEPCARMHKRINQLLKFENKYCIQYILTSFNKDLDCSCNFLIYINKNYNSEERDLVFNKWFNEGKYHKEKIFNEYHFNSKNKEKEYEKHTKWSEINNIKSTPEIFINGYRLPSNYTIEDLKYIIAVHLKKVE